MILVNVLLGFSQFFRAIPIMNPLPWFMIIVCEDELQKLKRLDPSGSGDAIDITIQ